MACMDEAINAGVDGVVEFGGGIGKGSGPADKRPNLEGMVKKAFKGREHGAEYFGAINAAGICSLAEHVL